jgi:hypothetical protein
MAGSPGKVLWYLTGMWILFVLAGDGFAQQEAAVWKCEDLLDDETKSALSSYETFFAELFSFPSEYQSAPQSQKPQIINNWIKTLQSNAADQIAPAAAYLGMVKAAQAARPLEQLIASGKGGGRSRWIATRSLGQIGDKGSIPVLINLLDNQNQNTRVYARVSLAEITGVYFGEDKEKWKDWQTGKIPQYGKTEDGPKAEPDSILAPPTVSDTNNPNVQAVAALRQLIDEKYSYRDLRGVNWDNMFSLYGPKMEKAKTKEEFAEIAAKMLSIAKDMHLWVKIGDQTVGGTKRNIQRNYRMDILEKMVPNWTRHNDRISTGRLEGGVGYILIVNWDTKDKSTLDPAFDALKTFSDCRSLIIDVRPNGGGGEGLAGEFAGCFIDKPALYSKHVCRDIKASDGWGKIHERILKPAANRPSYRGKIVVLMGQGNMSSCESFLLMMKQVPNCKLIGDKSYGTSGNPKPYDLGNGVTVWLPSWKALFPDGTCLEGVGIRPDIPVKTNESELRQRDPVLEKALKYLQGPKA